MGDGRPPFLIIGAPKCGTTAVAQYLAAHPEVSLSTPKEPHFFDGPLPLDRARYLASHFPRWDGRGAAGEATPSYLHLPWVAPRIHAMLPDARLIAMVRDPAARAFSSWWMLHVRGMEPLSFEDAIDAELAQPADALSPGAWQRQLDALAAGEPIAVRTYLAGGRYASNLGPYLERFGPDRVRVVFSDDLARDTEAVVRSLWRYIGVRDDVAAVDTGRVNERIGAGARPVLKFLQLTGLMRLRSLVPESVRNHLKKGLSRTGRAPEPEATTRRRLIDWFEPETAALERQLGVDLAAWRR